MYPSASRFYDAPILLFRKFTVSTLRARRHGVAVSKAYFRVTVGAIVSSASRGHTRLVNLFGHIYPP